MNVLTVKVNVLTGERERVYSESERVDRLKGANMPAYIRIYTQTCRQMHAHKYMSACTQARMHARSHQHDHECILTHTM